MPITQDRLIRLISAADSIIDSTRRLQRLIAEMKAGTDADPNFRKAQALLTSVGLAADHPAVEAFRLLFSSREAILDLVLEHRFPLDDMIAIAEERAHFKATARRNDSSRRAMRNLRDRRRSDEGEGTRASITLPAELQAIYENDPVLNDPAVEPSRKAAREAWYRAKAAEGPPATNQQPAPAPTDSRAAYERDREARRAAAEAQGPRGPFGTPSTGSSSTGNGPQA